MLNKWKGLVCFWMEKFNIINMLIFFEFIYKLYMILIKILYFYLLLYSISWLYNLYEN